jgi:hypothetical protein
MSLILLAYLILKKEYVMNKGIDEYARCIGFFRSELKNSSIKVPTEKITKLDVNCSVISNYDSTIDIKMLDGYDDINSELKELIKAHHIEPTDTKAIAVYIASQYDESANILLNRYRMDKMSIDTSAIYHYSWVYSLALGHICPLLSNDMGYDSVIWLKRKAICYLYSRSLSTAIALKSVQHKLAYNDIRDYAKNQSTETNIGVYIYDNYKNNIVEMMEDFKELIIKADISDIQKYANIDIRITKEAMQNSGLI